MFYGLTSCIARLLAGRVCVIYRGSTLTLFFKSLAALVVCLSFYLLWAMLSPFCVMQRVLGVFCFVLAEKRCHSHNKQPDFLNLCKCVKRIASAFVLANCLITSFAICSAPPFAGKFEQG